MATVLKYFLRGKCTTLLSFLLLESWKTWKDDILCRIDFCHWAFLKQFRRVLTILNKLEIFYLNTKLYFTYLKKCFFFKFGPQNNIKLWGFWPFCQCSWPTLAIHFFRLIAAPTWSKYIRSCPCQHWVSNIFQFKHSVKVAV